MRKPTSSFNCWIQDIHSHIYLFQVYRDLPVSSNGNTEDQLDFAGDRDFSCWHEYIFYVRHDDWLPLLLRRPLTYSWRLAYVTSSHCGRHRGSTVCYCLPVLLIKKLVCCLARRERDTSIPRNNNLPESPVPGPSHGMLPLCEDWVLISAQWE